VNESNELPATHDRNYEYLWVCPCMLRTFVHTRQLSGKTCVNTNVKYLSLILSYRNGLSHSPCLFSMAFRVISPLSILKTLSSPKPFAYFTQEPGVRALIKPISIIILGGELRGTWTSLSHHLNIRTPETFL